MKAFPGFHTISRIYQSTTTSVFKCRRLSDNLSVMIKTLNQEFPSNEKLDVFRHEYEIGRQLNFDGIIEMYSLEPLENSLFLVMEDFDAVSLQSLIAQNQMSLDYGLHIAKRLCTILEKIHDKSIIHKDLNPSNILVNPQSDTIKIIDFAFATELSRQNKINPTDKIQGTLSYIAPEQTGRMDRSVDYRSDYYSFGITLYEMITGRLPFVTQDPLRLIHCHIAKLPLSPHNLNLDIPGPVSSIVMKMIAKNPEERYQSIHGIRADLQTCLNQLKTTGNISDFKIGQHDIPHHFLISQKMYARNAEMDQLTAICNRIFSCHSHDQTSAVDSRQSEVVMIKGETGIGKTAFVDNYKDYILKNCPHEQVFFISGKIDQLSRNTPYSALVSAFSELIRHLLKMPESQLKQWRKKLKTALGDNGQLIVNVIPEIEWIIGEQPAIHNLSPTELQNRFEYVFQNFIMTFAAFDNPLIIFMDDLQWIDQASLKLIQLIVTNNDSVLLLIGAYRSSKLSDDHVLFRTIRSIEKQRIPVTTITLQPLSQTHINQFLCDTFNCESDYARVLTDIIVDKTQGNPFFMNELIASIHENKLIQLTQEGWKWDVQSIQELEITDNIALLMRKRLKRLSGSTLLFIQAAACIGIDFSKDMVTHILSDEEVNSDECIVEAMHENIIKECQQTLTDYDACTLTAYRFDDDHLRQTAFELIPENKRLLFHKKIGHYLLQISPGNQRKARIFSIVNHLNASVSLCDTPDEKIQLANLNHEAGLRAKSATAYEAAFSYFLAGVQLLNQNNWNDLYSLTFSLYIEAAEAAYLTGNFEEMLRLSEEVLSNTNQLMDQVKVYEIQLQACKMQDKKLEAIEIGQKVLAMLGVSIPKQSSKISTAIAIIRIYLGISGKRIDSLIDLPEMTDPKQLVITRILTYVGTAYYITSPEILPIIITEQIQLFTKYGNTPASSATYAAYGMLLCGMLNDLDNGYRYGRLAMSLLDRYKTKEYWPKTLFRVASFILHWKEHIRNTLPLFEEAFKYGIEMGDIEFSVFARYVGGIYSFLAGVELTTINKDISRSLDKTLEFKHLTAQYYKNLLRQLLTNLSSANETPWIFSGEYYQEETTLPSHIESKDRTITAMVHYSKGYINYLFGRFDDALICMENIKPYFKGLVSTFLIPCYYFFDTLIRLARYESLSRNEQKEQMKIISSHHKRISQWAKHAPMNHLHRFHLIQAEIYRVQNEKYLAMNHYDKAIHFAHEHQFLNDEALSNELTAKFYMQQSRKKHVILYLLDAYYLYQRCGMVSKTDHLQREYPFIKDHIELLDQTSSWCLLESDSQSFHHAAQEIDLVSIMKASTSISEEIVYSNLLEKLMTIVIENAGATRGCLLMIHNEQLFIEAEIADVSENESVNIESIPINKRSDLPIQLINYVKRTYKDILLKYAANEGDFTTDPYIRTAQIQSLMCMPILHHGKLTGLLYLENNQMTAAFTEKHVQILKMIASQAAISIENARFYNELEDRVQERTRALSQAIDALRARANELTMLNKMSDMLNECRQESETHEVLQQVCESLFPNDLGYIAIQAENQSSLEIIVQWNTVKEFDPSQIDDCESLKSAMKKRISGKAINNLCCQLQTEKMTEAVCIPLIVQDKAIGIFHLQFLQTSGNHEEDELQRLIQAREELAVRMAEQYTLSLVNLRLQKKLHMESIIDPLTKLFNRRYLEESLEREGNRCKRRGKNLGLIMLDIDHFKSFNDHYGHKVGDDVLCELGKFLKGTVRKEDIACRYGGEEFILILPESTIETTAVRAEDICQKICQQIKIVYGDEILTITASLGVAALDEHGPDIPEVIRSADEALYQAKKSGRNQVCVAKYS